MLNVCFFLDTFSISVFALVSITASCKLKFSFSLLLERFSEFLIRYLRLRNVLLMQECDVNDVTGKNPRHPYDELFLLCKVSRVDEKSVKQEH